MARRPNYRQQRNDWTRSKEAKKEKKLAKQQERVAQRKAAATGAPADPAGADVPASPAIAIPAEEKAG